MTLPSIRVGTVADFQPVLAALISSFGQTNPSHPLFDDLYPDILRPDDACMSGFRFIEVDGQLVAGLQVVRQRLVVAGTVDLEVGAVGQVYCLPAYRGRGFMSSLLKRALADMKAEGLHLSVLGGDRERYLRYGWDLVYNARECRMEPRPASTEVFPVRWLGDEVVLTRVQAEHEKLPYREIRTLDHSRAAFHRLGVALQTLGQPQDAEFAYAAFQRDELVEWGGDSVTLEALLRSFLAHRHLRVTLPPEAGQGELERLLASLATSVESVSTANVQVLSPDRLPREYIELSQPVFWPRLSNV